MTIKSGMNPVHPGLVLREELEDLGLSANGLAAAIDVPANRVTAILNMERGITADTALRLGRYFDTTAQFWLNLQQTWQLRVAERKSGARILECVVPRQVEAIRTAAGQAAPASGRAASMLRAIERNAALCDQLGAVERAIQSSASNQHRLRALAAPFDELRSVGVLQTAFGREVGRTAQWLVDYQKRFRVANAGRVGMLVEKLDATQMASTVARLAAMQNPWLDRENELGSVGRMLRLHEIGQSIGGRSAFSESAATRMRSWLGDWREPIAWPSDIWRDLGTRADFYADLGFDADLTDMPTAAFREAAEAADVRSEPLSLVESYGSLVPSSPAAETEAAFTRTNEAHDWLQRFESQLRQFIDAAMTQTFGPEWPRNRLPNGMYDSWEAKREAAGTGRPACAAIAYADFTDYIRVITRKDNWRELFERHFKRVEDVRESFQRLYPIRQDTMHARPISQDDELLLYVEVKRIMRAIEG